MKWYEKGLRIARLVGLAIVLLSAAVVLLEAILIEGGGDSIFITRGEP